MSIGTVKIDFSKHAAYLPLLNLLKKTAEETASDVYIVGGAVRDILMGKPASDFDVVPFGCCYETFARKLAKNMKGIAVPFKDNVRVVKDGSEVDVSKPRGTTILDDLKVRDFTVNSLGLSLSGDVLGDPSDIALGVVRIGYDEAFTDDAVRIFRAFRFVSTLVFQIDDVTLKKAAELKELLKMTASERILEEFKKMTEGAAFAQAVEHMARCGVAQIVFGCEFDHVAASRAKELCGASVAAITACACAEPTTSAERLGFSGKDMKLVKALLDAEKELEKVDTGVFRNLRVFAWRHRALISDIVPFYAAKYPDKSCTAEKIYEAFASLDIRKGELINGEMLKAEGYAPSPLFKRIIDETGTLLALGELEEDKLIEHILLNYPKR